MRNVNNVWRACETFLLPQCEHSVVHKSDICGLINGSEHNASSNKSEIFHESYFDEM